MTQGQIGQERAQRERRKVFLRRNLTNKFALAFAAGGALGRDVRRR